MQAHKINHKATNMMMTWLSTHHKTNKNVFVAVAVGTGVALLLLHVVANRLFSQMLSQVPASPSSRNMMASSSLRHAPPSFERPISLFQDEFFSSPFMIDSNLLELKREMDLQMQAFNQAFIGTPLLRGSPTPFLWDGFDITEDDNMVTVVVSIPDGIGTEDINIEVIDGAALHISGGVLDPMDRAKMHFEKRFALGRNMEQDKIAANLKDGTLTVTTPKAGLLESKEKDVRRKIPIKEEL
jgi:HSP20 family protein